MDYKYDTQLLVEGKNLSDESIKRYITGNIEGDCLLVVGDDESKAIAMSVLDHSLRADDVGFPTQDQEFVLYHIDGVEATGFISHLKLPHYVTFQSKLDSALRSAAEKGGEAR